MLQSAVRRQHAAATRAGRAAAATYLSSSSYSAAAACSSAAFSASAQRCAALPANRNMGNMYPSPSSLSSPSSPSQFLRSYSTRGSVNKGSRSLPLRTARHDREWDKIRKARDPHITTLDPAHPMPKLPPNDLEVNKLSMKYGLPPLPSLTERVQAYNIEQSFYDRRDQRIKDHIARLLRMKKLSKKEMLILIDQIESSHWNLSELQRAYLPEVTHAAQDEEDIHRKSLLVGTGGVANRAAYKKSQEEKKAARAANGPKTPKDDGEPKYGYRRDLANMGPENWDYLTPYMIFEPEARHLSHLDGAFKYEDRYVLWEEEHRQLALASKLQRMKLLGIPLEQAESMLTPEFVPHDPVFANAKIRRALARRLKSGGRADEEFWRLWSPRSGNKNKGDSKLLARKESRTLIEARRHIPDYIQRFEREQNLTTIDVGASTVLAQNLYLKSLIAAEKKKPSLLTAAQQDSAKALLGMFAQRNRLALKKMYLGTRNTWEMLMIERALEKKYLEQYNTIGSDFLNSKYLLKIEAEMMEVVEQVKDRFAEVDYHEEAIKLRDARLSQEKQGIEYADAYVEKMQELMEANGEFPDDANRNAGGRNWILDMLDWETNGDQHAVRDEVEKREAEETAALDRELDTWNDWYDVQVAEELSRMLDAGEIKDENNIPAGTVTLAENRVSMRLNATRAEWQSWKYRPQYRQIGDMNAPPADPTRIEETATEKEQTKSTGMKIVSQVLKSDPLMQASEKWKKRMAPRFAAVDNAEAEALPNTLLNHMVGGQSTATNAVSASGSSSLAPVVDGVSPDAVLPVNDASLSTTGLPVLDMDDPAQRRQAVAHVKTISLRDDGTRTEVEDPMLALLNAHTKYSRDGRSTAPKSADDDDGEDSGNRNSFSTIDPRLGFPDDDFRLYDPVLTKGTREAASEDPDAEQSLTQIKDEAAAEINDDPENSVLDDEERDPVVWLKEEDRAHRLKHFLDLDPFGPANTDERRDFDDQYMFLDEEEYAFRKRVDPFTEHQKPLTQRTLTDPEDQLPEPVRYDLSEETTELLYMLHRSDPVKYTPRLLAQKFKLSAERVKSQLVVQALHYRMVENGVAHPLMMEYNERRAVEDLLRPTMNMIHDPPVMESARMPDYRWVREDDLHRVLSEEKAIEDRFLSRGQRLDKAEQEYYAKYGAIGVDVAPPAEPELLDDRLMSPTRHNLMLIDISELPACRFTMALRDRRGFLREPTEEEYHFIRKREKGQHQFTYVKYFKEDNPM